MLTLSHPPTMTKSSAPVINRILSGSLILASLLIATPSWAGYTPVEPSAPSSPTTNTGRRGGCTGDLAAGLTVLAPKNHVGRTLSSHPTLAWFVPDEQPMPLELSIYDITEEGQRQLVYRTEMSSTEGVMALTLPEDYVGLEIGHRYTWQVVLLCNPNRPSSALVASTEMEVIPHTADLDTQLRQLNEAEDVGSDRFYQERSKLYANAGIWYDAIADALQQSSSSEISSILTLLDELAQYESSQNTPNEDLSSVIGALRSQS